MLLRRAVAALTRAGHAVRLAAPRASGSALVGPGPAEATALLALDGAEIAAVLGGESTEPLPERWRSEVVVALTRDPDLAARLAPPGVRLVQQDPAPPPGVHASRWLAERVRMLGSDPTPEPPVLRFTAEELAGAAPTLASLPPRFLAVHPGSGSRAKSWPAERFAAIVSRRAGGRRWLLVVGPADEEAAAPLIALPDVVVARALPLRHLAALLAHAGLYLGNDSGVTHLAAAAGAPTLALFGPTDPEIWAPLGPRVETLVSPDATMAGLDLEAVGAALEGVRCGGCGPPSG